MEGSRAGERQDPESTRWSSILLTRILVGAALIPLVVAVNYLGGLVFSVFVAMLAGVGAGEYYRMFPGMVSSPSRVIGTAGSVGLCLSFHWGFMTAAGPVLTILVVVILIERLVRKDIGQYAAGAGITLMGLVYTGWLLGFFILLRNLGQNPGSTLWIALSQPGREYVLLVLILTWSYDSLAYVGGSFLGRHKLFGPVSPSKTIEGVVFGLVGAAAAALISKAAFAHFMGWGQAVFVGIFLGVVAQVGDLVESMIKRSTRTKDSSHLIPGHGGLLDRFDSLLLTGPVFYLYLRTLQGVAL